MPEAAAWALLLGTGGAVAGSFLSTIVVRWPAGRSVLAGRSACDGCGRTLRARDLVPLISALAQRGRCRTCGARIDPRHWLVEAGCVLVGVAAAIAAPGAAAIAGAVLGCLLVTLAALDIAELWLPDVLTGALAAAGLASGMAGIAPDLDQRLIGGVAGYVVLASVAFGYRLLRGRDGLGGGDPKLFGAIGLWVGWPPLPAILLLAALVGLGGVLTRRLAGRPVAADEPLPFGALLAIAAYPAWLMMIGTP